MAGVSRESSIHARVWALLLGLGLSVGCGLVTGASENDVPGSNGGRRHETGGTSTAPPQGGSSGASASGGAGGSEAGRAEASAGESSAGSASTGGASTGGASTGGASTGGASTGGATSGEGGSAGEPASDPYAPRSGPFKVLGYTRTTGYRTPSIPDGIMMLEELASAQGFELTLTESKEDFNPENLAAHELVLFLHTTGNVFDAPQEEAFEDWMVNHAGAFVGVGRAVETELDWNFYKELTGQYGEGHSACCPEAEVTWTPDALAFPAVEGLPSPWRIEGLWYLLSNAPQWSKKPGFKILGTVFVEKGDGRIETPVSFAREFDGYRSFYAGFGHQSTAFEDTNVRRHIAAGILWTVRRAHLIR